MSVAHAIATVTLSPTPTTSPVATVVATTAAAVVKTSPTDTLNRIANAISPADLIATAGIVATAIQAQLNKLPWLRHAVDYVQDTRRFVVAVVLPIGGTLLAGLATGHNTLNLAPWVFAVSQLVFYVAKSLKSSGVTTGTTVETPVLAVEETPAG